MITEVSTQNAKLGKNVGLKNKEDKKKMIYCSVFWDFSNYSDAFINLPLRTSGSIAFPEEMILDKKENKYLLIFFSSWKVEEAKTILEFKKNDLVEQFKKTYNT
jgi:hypothetical protein